MKKLFCALLSLFMVSGMFAQDDINLLDLIKDTPAITDTQQVNTTTPADATPQEYDWRSHRHSFTLTLGTLSLVENFVAELGWILTLGDQEMVFVGPASLQYDYNILRWLRVGGRFSYGYQATKGMSPVYHAFFMSGRVDFTFLNKRKVKLYAGLETGLGLSLNQYPTHNEDNFVKVLPVIGFCPLGIQAGGDHVYFMAETNIGNTEIFRLGIGMHF